MTTFLERLDAVRAEQAAKVAEQTLADMQARDAAQQAQAQKIIQDCQRAILDALGAEDGAEVLAAASLEIDSYSSVGARMEIAGLDPIKVLANGGTRTWRGDGWSTETRSITEAIQIARYEWLERTAAEERKRAALAEWGEAYRAYCNALEPAWQHNSAILGEIAADFATRPFNARRLTYGIVFGDGADPATETAWALGVMMGGTATEILPNGRTETVTFWHPVKTGEARTWTARSADESTDPAPPIRQTMIEGWRIIGPPASAALTAEVQAEIERRGGLREYPQLPEKPAGVETALFALASEIEREIFTADDLQITALARRLFADSLEIPY